MGIIIGPATPGWQMAGAQVRGVGNLRRSRPGQDRIFCLRSGKVFIITLADGAGSCRRSGYGAEIATRTVAWFVARWFDKIYAADNGEVPRMVLMPVIRALGKAIQQGESLRDYSSTLLLAAVKGEEFIVGHLGDGVVGCLDDHGCFVMSFPDNVEFCNVTYFTTHDTAFNHLRVIRGELKGRKGFVLMSDGAAESLYERSGQRLAPAVARMFNWFQYHSPRKIGCAVEDNLRDVLRHKTQDDCSLVLMRLLEGQSKEFLGD